MGGRWREWGWGRDEGKHSDTSTGETGGEDS
uniref:Uncharacterized protein n=1 Tax=Trichinella nativa TaxID=6335 RepID=A0A0V1KIR7_9BILA